MCSRSQCCSQRRLLLRSDYDDGDSDYGDAGYRDEGTFSLKPGLGFTSSPTSLLLGFEGDYRIAEPVSLGLLTEVGIDDDVTIVSPQLFARYWPDLGELIDPDVAFVEPYAHLGIGFTWWDADVYKGVDDDDTQFLLSPGFGVDFRINETRRGRQPDAVQRDPGRDSR